MHVRDKASKLKAYEKIRSKAMERLDSERLRHLDRIKPHLSRTFHDIHEGMDWLKQPNPALGGAVPYDLLSTDEGFQQVDDILTRIEYGVYS